MADLETDPSAKRGDRYSAGGLYLSDAIYLFFSAASGDRRTTEDDSRL